MAQKLQYQEQLLGDSYYKILRLLGVSVGVQIPEDGEKYTDAEWAGVRESLGKLLYQYLRDNPDKKDEFIAKINDIKNNDDGALSIGRGARKHLGEKLEKAYNNIASTPDKTKEEEVSLKTDSHTEIKPKQEETEESAKEEKSEKDKEDKKKDSEKEVAKTDTPTTTAELKKEEEPEPMHEDVDWIKQKREFWKKYAGDIAHDFKEKEDAPEGTFEGTLYEKDKSQGSVRYTAPDRVEISKDSELATYRGVVKEIAQSGNTLTLGNSLNDKQKLMFYAAVLKEGSKVKIMNPPVLTKDMVKSKDLPEEIQKILGAEYSRLEAQKAAKEKEAKAEAEAKAKAEIEKAAKERLTAIAEEIKKIQKAVTKAATDKERLDLKKQELNLVKEKLAIDNEAAKRGVNIFNTDDREQVRKDQIGLMQQTFDAAPNKPLFKSKDGKIDQEKAERIVAARMGIISGEKTSTGTEIKKDDKYAERKKAQNPLYEKYLTERYASKGS